MEQIEINGLLWDTENLEIQGEKYFTWQEAMDAAKSVGKRLPTKEELEKLIDAGWEWDDERKGMWLADKKLFFSLSGFIHYINGELVRTDDVYLWSSYSMSDLYSWSLYLTDDNARMSYSYALNGFSIRCVQDIKSDISSLGCTKE